MWEGVLIREDIKKLVADAQKTWSGNISVLGGDSSTLLMERPRISTGLKEMDRATGGGYVKGVMHEIFGNEGEGKTTLVLHGIAEIQKAGEAVLFVDAEHSLNLEYAARIGVDLDNLIIVQPDYGEQGLDITQFIMESGLVGCVVIDSVSALVPKSEIDGDFTDANMGAHARMMSKLCRVFTPIISRNDIILILINQVRLKIGQFMGNPEVTTGGKGIKFYSGMRIRVSSSKVEGTEDVRELKAKFVKHKWGKMYAEAEMRIVLGEGIDSGYDQLVGGIADQSITQKGSCYYYNGELLGNGKANAIKKLKELLNEQKESS